MPAERQVIAPPAPALDAGRVEGRPYSTVVRGGAFLFVAGLTAIDPQTGARVRGTTAAETRAILTNLKQLLEAAGSSLDKVVKVTVLMHSMLEAPNMNEVYASFFSDPPPARTVCGAALRDGCRVVIECVALA
jgi:2-iminobutanoate/2-iminopropanoate deaminase